MCRKFPAPMGNKRERKGHLAAAQQELWEEDNLLGKGNYLSLAQQMEFKVFELAVGRKRGHLCN